MNRRFFLSISTFLGSFIGLSSNAEILSGKPKTWRAGDVLHILPAVSDTELLLKISLKTKG